MRPISIVVLVIVLSFLFMIFYSVSWQPFATEITQDRPIVKKLCEMQAGCRSITGPFMCTDDPEHDNHQRLSRWNGFHGCNNETLGYKDGYVTTEACSCGGIM